MSLENLLCNGISLFSNKIGETLEGPLAVNIVDAFTVWSNDNQCIRLHQYNFLFIGHSVKKSTSGRAIK